jgi:arylsulfatase A-like enzyme
MTSAANANKYIEKVGDVYWKRGSGWGTGQNTRATRFSLYTGRYPGRLPGGLPEPIGSPAPEIGIPPSHPTLASLLRDVGYDTALYGKWHCGYLTWFGPLKSGWNEFFGNLSGAVDYFRHTGTDGLPDLFEAEVPVEEIGYYTDLLRIARSGSSSARTPSRGS